MKFNNKIKNKIGKKANDLKLKLNSRFLMKKKIQNYGIFRI